MEQTFGQEMMSRRELSAAQQEMSEDISKDFAALADKLNAIRDRAGQSRPNAGRLASTAITQLELAALAANKAITRL